MDGVQELLKESSKETKTMFRQFTEFLDGADPAAVAQVFEFAAEMLEYGTRQKQVRGKTFAMTVAICRRKIPDGTDLTVGARFTGWNKQFLSIMPPRPKKTFDLGSRDETWEVSMYFAQMESKNKANPSELKGDVVAIELPDSVRAVRISPQEWVLPIGSTFTVVDNAVYPKYEGLETCYRFRLNEPMAEPPPPTMPDVSALKTIAAFLRTDLVCNKSFAFELAVDTERRIINVSAMVGNPSMDIDACIKLLCGALGYEMYAGKNPDLTALPTILNYPTNIERLFEGPHRAGGGAAASGFVHVLL